MTSTSSNKSQSQGTEDPCASDLLVEPNQKSNSPDLFLSTDGEHSDNTTSSDSQLAGNDSPQAVVGVANMGQGQPAGCDPPSVASRRQDTPEVDGQSPIDRALLVSTTKGAVDIAIDQPSVSTVEAFPDRVLFRPDSTACAQLAQSTSVVIATLLTIPDAFALIPGAKSLVGWVLNLIGNWVAAAVLWFVGFLAVLHLVRFAVRGVEVSNGGIKMWRFARPIAWSRVDAIGVEPQKFFSKLFRLQTTARRLTIFERKKARGNTSKLLPHYLPSFYFTASEFENLCRCAFAKKFACSPTSIDVFVAADGTLPAFRKMFGHLHWQRLLVSILIAVGLTMWLYRKATVNYAYNSGNKAMAHADFVQAKHLYEWAIATEGTFAPAYNMLGNAEYHLSDLAKAREHWRKALFLKPDFVEPRISLSHLAAREGNYKKARELLDSALNLNPLNVYALVNRADLEMSSGQVREAMSDARIVMAQGQAQGNGAWNTAACLLARGKLRLGQLQDAQNILKALPPLSGIPGPDAVNSDLRLNVSGETAFALGRLDQAERFYRAARKANPASAEAVFGLATVDVAEHIFDQAHGDIDVARRMMPNSPGPGLLYARSQMLQGNTEQAQKILAQAMAMPNIDSTSLTAAAALYEELGMDQPAVVCAQRALACDPENRTAKALIQRVSENSLKVPQQE